MNKRGMNQVIAIVLMLLLVLAAIVIIWAFVRVALQGGSQQIEPDILTVNFEIPKQSITIDETPNAEIPLKFVLKRRVGGGELAGVNIILEDSDKNSRNIPRLDLKPKELETVYVEITSEELEEFSISEVAKICISAEVINEVEGNVVTAPKFYCVKTEGIFDSDGDNGDGDEPVPTTCSIPPLATQYSVSGHWRHFNNLDCSGSPASEMSFSGVITSVAGGCAWVGNYPAVSGISSVHLVLVEGQYWSFNALFGAIGGYTEKNMGSSPAGAYPELGCQDVGSQDYSVIIDNVVVSEIA